MELGILSWNRAPVTYSVVLFVVVGTLHGRIDSLTLLLLVQAKSAAVSDEHNNNKRYYITLLFKAYALFANFV